MSISETTVPAKARFLVLSLAKTKGKLSLVLRSRIDIIASILRVAEGGAKKTRIMYQCNLSFKQVNVYLSFLVERGLLEFVPQKGLEKNDSIIYGTTGKGRAFIQAYRNIRALLSS